MGSAQKLISFAYKFMVSLVNKVTDELIQRWPHVPSVNSVHKSKFAQSL